MTRYTILLQIGLLTINQINAKISINARQMLTYLKNNKMFGPRQFSFNSYVSLIDQDFSRKVVLQRHGEFTRANVDKVLNGKVYGLAVITPSSGEHNFSSDWIATYNYLSEKNVNYGVYFIEHDQNLVDIIRQLETEQRRSHIKFITSDSLSKVSPKIRVNDFVGEVKKDFSANYQFVRSSTILLTGMDTLFGNTQTSENFVNQGTGLLAQISVARILSHFIKQFREPVSNLIYYFSSTKFDNYVSFSNFLGSNENTHFTTGAKQIVVLDSLTSGKSFDIDVYNIEEDRLSQNQFFNDLKKMSRDMNFNLNVKYHNEMLFNTTVLPIFVFKDTVPSVDMRLSLDDMYQKIRFLQLFFLNQVYGISTETIVDEIEDSIRQKEFVKKTQDFIKSVPRSPLDMQKDSEFMIDMERLVGLYTEKHIRTSYRIDNHEFYRSQISTMTIAVAKHGFTDQFTFQAIIVWVIALHMIFRYMTFSEKSK